VTASIAKLQDWMKNNAPGVAFRPPANPDALDNFAEKCGLTLPDDLRQLLLVTDGETRKSPGSIGNWRIMPINEIQAAWGLLTQLSAKGAFSDLAPEHSPYLRADWWHSSWIPVVSSDTGDYFCIDTDPPETERAGQVLLYRQEQPARPLVAANLAGWLDRITHDLSAGIYTYDQVEGFNGEAFLWSSLEGKHLLDDIEGTLVV
jgi:cell wall assembly regulator SMI1